MSKDGSAGDLCDKSLLYNEGSEDAVPYARVHAFAGGCVESRTFRIARKRNVFVQTWQATQPLTQFKEVKRAMFVEVMPSSPKNNSRTSRSAAFIHRDEEPKRHGACLIATSLRDDRITIQLLPCVKNS